MSYWSRLVDMRTDGLEPPRYTNSFGGIATVSVIAGVFAGLITISRSIVDFFAALGGFFLAMLGTLTASAVLFWVGDMAFEAAFRFFGCWSSALLFALFRMKDGHCKSCGVPILTDSQVLDRIRSIKSSPAPTTPA